MVRPLNEENTIKKTKREFKKLKRNKKMLLIINVSEVPIHLTFEKS